MKITLSWLQSYFMSANTTNRMQCNTAWANLATTLTASGLEVEDSTQLANGDTILELKITPNRGDCLSVRGLVREIAALLPELTLNSDGQHLIHHSQLDWESMHSKNWIPALTLVSAGMTRSYAGMTSTTTGMTQFCTQTVTMPLATVDNTCLNHCPNYAAIAISGINNQVTLPQEILSRLTQSGIASVSPIVDITNYVMLTLGQPLHAFDLSQVATPLNVRLAKEQESITLIDNTKAALSPNTLVIADTNNQVIAIAGVMGGLNAAVTATTTAIVLESAYFSQDIIAGIAKQYNIHSEAAYRFERGVDPQLPLSALHYTAQLITHYCGGVITAPTQLHSEHYATCITRQTVSISYQQIKHMLGIATIPHQEIAAILTRLGFSVTAHADALTIIPPSYRFDINYLEDVVEEIARVYGYDNIPPVAPITVATLPHTDANTALYGQLKHHLVTLGFNEIISYAFLEQKYETLLGHPITKAIKLQNPIADLSVMRTSLIADLVKSLIDNLNRGLNYGGSNNSTVRLFELARVFQDTEATMQPLRLAGLMYGQLYPVSWAHDDKQMVDFFAIKFVVSQLLAGLDNVQFVACQNYPVLHPGICATIVHANTTIGIIGKINPSLATELGLTANLLPYVFELDITYIASLLAKSGIKAKPVSSFQKVARDLAFIVANNLQVGEMITAINAANIDYLIDVTVFDVYHMPQQNTKSVALRCILQADNKTLTDSEINHATTHITDLIACKFAAKLR